LLDVRGVTKRFGSVTALNDVSVSFLPGEIHAVLGENGAGKSTLMSVLAGFVEPDHGSVVLDKREIPLGRPFECKRLGIEMIHQHFTLVPAFSAAENLALARLPGVFSLARTDVRIGASVEAAKRLGWRIPEGDSVQEVSVGDRQRLEILKALGGDARVIVFDEPTAVLAPAEVEDLFRVLRVLRDEGKIVVLIAHKLAEVLSIADRVTVLRRGELQATAKRSDVTAELLAQWMVGEMPSRAPEEPTHRGEVVLSLRDLRVVGDRGEESVRGVSLEIRAGEICGIGGVDGNGQLELAEAIVGVREVASGTLQRPESVGYVPQDRQSDGLALNLSVAENLLVGGYRRPTLTRGPMLRLRAIREWASQLVRDYEVRPADADLRARSLSGGNQQKVVVARELDREPQLLVAVTPTRGLDIRAAQAVHDRLRLAARGGAAVLLITTDLDELFSLAGETFFINGGQLLRAEDAQSLLGGAD
jgi:simple sugar transport system ATP-binding protein